VDFLTATSDLFALPLIVEKCLAHQRVKAENERLQRDLSDSLTELSIKNHQLQALVRQLEATARTDDLTGLCNRRSLNELLERAWKQAVRSSRPLAFMMIDLDDFKAVNDTQGHQRGDEILREAGRIIRSNCRQVDVPARYGGDEFCVLMPESEAEEVVQVARRVLRQWELANKAKAPGEPRLGMSIGVAQIDESDPKSSEELIHHADEALYAAKAAGKGRIMRRDLNGIRAVPTSADGEMPISEVVLIDRDGK
jgi:diguanylate cyclase (GGDEF)-like protein